MMSVPYSLTPFGAHHEASSIIQVYPSAWRLFKRELVCQADTILWMIPVFGGDIIMIVSGSRQGNHHETATF